MSKVTIRTVLDGDIVSEEKNNRFLKERGISITQLTGAGSVNGRGGESFVYIDLGSSEAPKTEAEEFVEELVGLIDARIDDRTSGIIDELKKLNETIKATNGYKISVPKPSNSNKH